jgi:hypothetical protein
MHKKDEKYSYHTHSLIGCEVAPDMNPACIAAFWISSDQTAGTYLNKIIIIILEKERNSIHTCTKAWYFVLTSILLT